MKVLSMIKTNIFSSFSAIILGLLFSSCVDVPLRISVQKSIEIDSKQFKKLSDKIFTILSQIEPFYPRGTAGIEIDPNQCTSAYKNWLRGQFDLGRLPD